LKFEIISVYEKLDDYIKELERPNANAQALWEKYAIEPFWLKLSEYAPTDASSRKPKPVGDVGRLRKQVGLLKQLDVEELNQVFEKIASVLTDDEVTMTVALYPIDNYWVRMAQNGVLGTCMWGHIIISIDPLAEGYEAWIPYVFGHECFHNLWGRYWDRLHPGELDYIFVNDLLCDGLADTFALSLCPGLKPKWLFDISEEAEKKLWNEHFSQLIERTDVSYTKYMIGDDLDIPWCAGFAIGYRLAQQYLKSHPNTSMRELLGKRPIDIFNESGYAKLMKR
jgi:uncharacterized protein YjaZ